MTTPLHRQDDRLLIETFRFAACCARIQLLVLEHLNVALEYGGKEVARLPRGTKAYGVAMRRQDSLKEALVLERTRLAVFKRLEADTAQELDRRGYPRGEYDENAST